MRLRFPSPPPELSPNARVHWARRAKAAREYRQLVGFSALGQMQRQGLPKAAGRVMLMIIFCHEDHRERDPDNLLASFKAGLDGLRDAGAILGDSTKHLSALALAWQHRDPCVIVDIEADAAALERAE